MRCMWIEIKFENVLDVNMLYDSCDINIHKSIFRFFNETIYCFYNSTSMKIKMKQICRRLNKRFEWDGM